MYQFYLLEHTLDGLSESELKAGLLDLMEATKPDNASDLGFCYYWDGFYQLEAVCLFLFGPSSQERQTLLGWIEQLSTTEASLYPIKELDSEYPPAGTNAYFGIGFEAVDVDPQYQIRNNEDLKNFLNRPFILKECDFKTHYKQFFSRIDFIPEVIKQIERQKVANYESFVSELLRFDIYLKRHWDSDEFNVRKIKDSYSARFSGESDSVNQNLKLRNARTFWVPNRGMQYFELHIKVGDRRIHIWPDHTSRTVWVGYMGKHLPTAKYS